MIARGRKDSKTWYANFIIRFEGRQTDFVVTDTAIKAGIINSGVVSP